MKFINHGEPILIRVGTSYECYWKTIKKNEIVDLPPEEGKGLGLTEVTPESNQVKPKLTEGQLGNKKVETKQIDNWIAEDLFFKELTKIKGIGKKTAKDILRVFKTKEILIEAVDSSLRFPFRDDVEEKLRRRYGK